ncbi:hypothetical protein FRB98_001353 [Tulasnella sp. 332]|nr:hypothetical protein FRB98_001353 [Tulasnella sp. 332]
MAELLKSHKPDSSRQSHPSFNLIDKEGIMDGESSNPVPMNAAQNTISPITPGRSSFEQYFRDLDPVNLEATIVYLRERSSQDPATSQFFLAQALSHRYRLYGNRADFDESIIYYQRTLDRGAAVEQDRAEFAEKFATTLLDGYQRLGGLDNLEKAILLLLKVLELRPKGHALRSRVLLNLAIAAKARYQAVGTRNDLEEACSWVREALNIDLGSTRPFFLNTLATTLQLRFEQYSNRADLDEAICCHTEALALRPQGNPLRSTSVINLAIALLIRFKQTGERADLSTAISQLEGVLALPLDPIRRAMSLTELANALVIRWKELGEQEDLDAGISRHREALELRPAGNPERPKTLCNLAFALVGRFQTSKQPQDINDAFAFAVEAVNSTLVGAPGRLNNLQALASTSRILSQINQNQFSIDFSVDIFRSILDVCPPTDSSRANFLQEAAGALLDRYNRFGNDADVRIAVSYLEESIEITPQSKLFVTNDGILPDVAKAINLLRDAANQDNAPISERLKAAMRWVSYAEPIRHASLGGAYTISLQLMDMYITTSRRLESQHDRLAHHAQIQGINLRLLASAAAAYAIERLDYARAVEILEQGRQIIMNTLFKYRTIIDDLADVDEGLAKNFSRLSAQMESLGDTDQMMLSLPPEKVDKVARYEAAQAEWNQTVERIRQLPGFSTFLNPTPFSTLRAAAAGGPVVLINVSYVRSDAIVIPQDLNAPPRVIPLPDATLSAINKLSRDLHEIIAEQPLDLSCTAKLAEVLRSLWRIAVQPVAVVLQGELKVPRRSRVWWCLTSAAWSLPFHAAGLYLPKERNFADRYTSSYTPTLTALLRARATRGSKPSPLQDPRILVVAMPHTSGEADLPFVPQEVARIEAPGRETTKLEGSEVATRDAVLTYLHDHSWVHFACHGYQDKDQAFNSHFSLDQKLTLLDIIRSGLPNAELAVLSACHSAAGDLQTPDEAIHLAAGLQFAGYRSVVGTMWATADEDGPVIAEEFYNFMFKKPEKVQHTDAAEALSNAMVVLRRKKVPLERWINFVHYGA